MNPAAPARRSAPPLLTRLASASAIGLGLVLSGCDKTPPKPPQPKAAAFRVEPATLILVPMNAASAPVRLI